jgi:hypothetical protein
MKCLRQNVGKQNVGKIRQKESLDNKMGQGVRLAQKVYVNPCTPVRGRPYI